MYPLGAETLTNLVSAAYSGYKLYKAAKGASAKHAAALDLLQCFDTTLCELETHAKDTPQAIAQVQFARAAWQDVGEYLEKFEAIEAPNGKLRARQLGQRVRWAVSELDGKLDVLHNQLVLCLQAIGIRQQVTDSVKLDEALRLLETLTQAPSDVSSTVAVVSDKPGQIDVVPCTQRKGGCFCACHTTTLISSSNYRYLFAHRHGDLMFRQRCQESCNSRRYGLSLRIVGTRFGVPFALNMSWELNFQAFAFGICPTLSVQNVRRYTAPGFVELEKLASGRCALRERALQVSEIKRLFKVGEVHPRDVDPAGKTWLEKLLEAPWRGQQQAQWELVQFVACQSNEIKNSTRLLWLCMRWIGEGPHLAMFQTLLQHGLDPGSMDAGFLRQWPRMSDLNWLGAGDTPDPFFVEVMRQCLQTSPGFADCGPLTEAVLTADDEEFERVLAYSVKTGPSGLASSNAFGQSALHLAIASSPKRLEILLEHGSNVDDVDNQGATALIYAAAYGQSESVLLLLHYNANPWLHDCFTGRGFLDHAVERGHFHIVEDVVAFLREDSLSEAAMLLLDRTILYFAINGNALRDGNFIRRLLALGADADVDHRGSTLIHFVRSSEESQAVLSAGFTNVDSQDPDGLTPLISCLKIRCPSKTIAELLARGADVNIQDARGWSALHHMCERAVAASPGSFGGAISDDSIRSRIDVTSCLGMLLGHGADVSARDSCTCACGSGGCSPMTLALHCTADTIQAPPVLSDFPAELWAACRSHPEKARVQFLNDMERYLAFQKAGLKHTCCRGRCGMIWGITKANRAGRAGDAARHQELEQTIQPGTTYNPLRADDQFLTDLAMLYADLEDRSRKANSAAAKREQQFISRPRAPLLKVDYDRDEFVYRGMYMSTVPNLSRFNVATHQACLDQCSQQPVRPGQKGLPKEFVDFQRQALSKIGSHLDRLRA